MEAVNDALKYVVQARKLLKELCICIDCGQGTIPHQQDSIDTMAELLEKAEEALVKTK
jgi:hypothetical protein